MKVIVVIGTRPQIIKVSVLLHGLNLAGIQYALVHTGQHYDKNLSAVFFQQLQIPQPDYNLEVGVDSPKNQIKNGVRRLIEIVKHENPKYIIVIGDSNPALIGCLTALDLGAQLVHCESGLRSGNMLEPEERNRVIIDTVSDYLFCSTNECIENLTNEATSGKYILTGDLLRDAWVKYENLVEDVNTSEKIVAPATNYCIFTLHRRSNVYNRKQFELIFNMLTDKWDIPTVWSLHPGAFEQLKKYGFWNSLQDKKNLFFITPATYIQMRQLLKNCSFVITDSVGLQVEAYFAKKHSIILRNELEHRVLVEMGWSMLVRPNRQELDTCNNIIENFVSCVPQKYDNNLFGSGNAAINMALELN